MVYSLKITILANSFSVIVIPTTTGLRGHTHIYNIINIYSLSPGLLKFLYQSKKFLTSFSIDMSDTVYKSNQLLAGIFLKKIKFLNNLKWTVLAE